mgnify:CR=1 FL=1
MWKFLILVVGVLFPWWSDAQESKEPWFITDVAVGDAGQVILSCRGDKSLKITDPQGRQVVKTIPLQQTPTGVIAKEGKGRNRYRRFEGRKNSKYRAGGSWCRSSCLE